MNTSAPATPPPLGPVDVHVWFRSLSASDLELSECSTLLSSDEKDRAARFHFDIHRNRFMVARATLRRLLSAYTPARSQDLEFSYGEYGKPVLPDLDLHFNVSHSENCALFAFTRMGPVGVDLEVVRCIPEMLNLARQVFSVQEYEWLTQAPPDEQAIAFFRCWTRKEALVKAMGMGLSYPLQKFTVNFDAFRPAVVAFDARLDTPEQWTLGHVEPEKSVIGAIAIRNPSCRCREFSTEQLCV